MVLKSSQGFSEVVKCSQWLSVVLKGFLRCSVYLSVSQVVSLVLKGSLRFSGGVLSDSQGFSKTKRFSVILKDSQWFSKVL